MAVIKYSIKDLRELLRFITVGRLSLLVELLDYLYLHT